MKDQDLRAIPSVSVSASQEANDNPRMQGHDGAPCMSTLSKEFPSLQKKSCLEDFKYEHELSNIFIISWTLCVGSFP